MKFGGKWPEKGWYAVKQNNWATNQALSRHIHKRVKKKERKKRIKKKKIINKEIEINFFSPSRKVSFLSLFPFDVITNNNPREIYLLWLMCLTSFSPHSRFLEIQKKKKERKKRKEKKITKCEDSRLHVYKTRLYLTAFKNINRYFNFICITRFSLSFIYLKYIF